MTLAEHVRAIPDHPKPGVLYRDITPLLADAAAFREAVTALCAPFANARIDKVAAIEARGFILGGAVAHQLRAGFVPLRKFGKLPGTVVGQEYTLEYGTDVLEMHADAVAAGQRVLLVDDLIATGGTAEAGIALLRNAGAGVVAAAFLIDLPELGGAQRLRDGGVPVTTLLSF